MEQGSPLSRASRFEDFSRIFRDQNIHFQVFMMKEMIADWWNKSCAGR